MTAPFYRSEAPSDWFVDPAERGVPGSPAAEGIDDDGALSWQAEALCAQTDPEAFFPEKGGSTRDAKRICESCDVRAQCLEYALANDERFGIWGGLSERERRRLKREQQAS
ncbi:MAG: WhiB family transcriptional regulator [Candidatus Microbacterium stercoravium]